jgi:hypothetical protein
MILVVIRGLILHATVFLRWSEIGSRIVAVIIPQLVC